MEEEVRNEARSLPLIGEPAPEFDVLTTHGKISLSQYRASGLFFLPPGRLYAGLHY